MDLKIDKRKAQIVQKVEAIEKLQNPGNDNLANAQEAYRERTLAGLECYARGELVSLEQAMLSSMSDEPESEA